MVDESSAPGESDWADLQSSGDWRQPQGNVWGDRHLPTVPQAVLQGDFCDGDGLVGRKGSSRHAAHRLSEEESHRQCHACRHS